MTQPAYLRFPAVHGDRLVFVTEDDLWTADVGGGPARRLTADLLEVGRPALSPDGSLVAFTSTAQGQPDLYVMAAAGGPARRLTWMGEVAVCGWTPDGRVVISSSAGQPFPALAPAYAVAPEPVAGGGVELLPYGPVRAVAYGAAGGVVIGRNTADPARWKRYRGGTAGALWIDVGGTGQFRPLLDAAALDGSKAGMFPGNLASPMWVGDRIWFLSDHEGIGNLYSCAPSGTDLRRHTDHDEHYARWASTDGSRIVYQVAAQLWAYDVQAGEAGPIAVEVGSPRTQRRSRFVDADHNLGGFALDRAGDRLAVDVRGKLVTLEPWEGAVRQHGQGQGVRYRLGRFVGERTVVAVSDEGGEEGIEVHEEGGWHRIPVPDLGRVVELVPSPDGTRLAVTNHRSQLLLVDRSSGATRVLDESTFGQPGEPAWSPDGAWLAYAIPASHKARHIRLAEVESGRIHHVTPPRFHDSCPCFDPEGRYLCFLSRRTFDPVYDSILFDLGFPKGGRPYLVTLRADDPSPFLRRPPAPRDRPGGDQSGQPGQPGQPDQPGQPGQPGQPDQPPLPPEVRVDLPGMEQRVLAFPVPEARYEGLALVPGKVLLLSRPVEGARSRRLFTGPPANGTVDVYDLAEGKHETLLHYVSDMALSGDGSHLLYATADDGGARSLRLLAAGAKPPEDVEDDPPSRANGWIDLGRVRVEVDPGGEWVQMLAEAWRLQREEFWVADLSGVDWDRVLARYLPLVEAVATRSEFSDLVWEMQGELGTSHAYELGGDYRHPPGWGLGRLGADLAWDGEAGRWRVRRLASGTSWDPDEAAPLRTPGAGLAPGTAILAVNGQPVPAEGGPDALLVNRAGQPVELTVEGPDDGARRQVLVPALADERPLRYRDWVEANRVRVHDATAGRAGYLHIPDMMAPGFAEFHRSYLTEVEREALVVDVRYNNGGHVSGLLLSTLARRRIGYDVSRWGGQAPYLPDSPGGPMVLVTNEWAGSDGDIFTHGFRLLGLGPVVGVRTWGGVIGIEPTHALVDGSLTTQPEYAYWFVDVGWGVENHGADPDHEVVIAPQDHAAGRDPQLDTAVSLVLEALAAHEAPQPDLATRPRLELPRLPSRL